MAGEPTQVESPEIPERAMLSVRGAQLGSKAPYPNDASKALEFAIG